jgi:hypothetical protein
MPTESKNWLPLLLAAMIALAGLVLWDRQSGDGASPAAVRTAEKSPRVPAVSRSGRQLQGDEQQGKRPEEANAAA